MATETQPPENEGKKPTVASVLVPVAVVLAGVLFTLSYLRDRGASHEHAGAPATGQINRKVGEALPDLEFNTLDGKSVHLSELKAKVLVINFWATWCGPCVKEMPSFQKLANEYADRGLVVVGVNVDENPEAVLVSFLEKHGIKFQSFVDPTGKLADRFSISGLPLTLVLDGNKKLLLEQLGDEEWFSPTYRKQFELWLAEKTSG